MNKINTSENALVLRYSTVFMFLGTTAFGIGFLFLPLYLRNTFKLSAASIGAIVSSVALISSVISPFMGKFVDQFGAVRVTRISPWLYSICSLIWFLIPNFSVFLVSLLFMSLTRSISLVANKSLFARADDGHGRAFRLRYIALTFGFATAAVLGRIFHQWPEKYYFLLAASLYSCAGIWCLAIRVREEPSQIKTTSRQKLPKATKRAIVPIVLFGSLVLSMIIQFESTSPLYLVEVFGEEGEIVYRNQLILMGILAFTFGTIYNKIRTNFPSIREGTMIGMAVTIEAASLALIFSSSQTWQVYLGCVSFVIAEAILAPCMDSLATQLTKAGNRSQIMGILEIRQLFMFLGAFAGGWLLDHTPNLLAPIFALTAICTGLTYLWAKSAVKAATKLENLTPSP